MANNKRHPLSCVSGSTRAPDPVSFYSRCTIVPGCLFTVVSYRVSNTWSLNPDSVAINCGDQRKRPLRLRPPCLESVRVCVSQQRRAYMCVCVCVRRTLRPSRCVSTGPVAVRLAEMANYM
jgi:hypothetical protein